MKKLFIVLALSLVSTAALAAEGSGSALSADSLKYFAYFIAVGLAAFGGTQAQSKAVAVALDGIARNPSAANKIQTPMILGLALMESLVIFTLISVFLA